MGIVLIATILGFAVGLLGTVVGGGVAKIAPCFSRLGEGNMVGFSGGVMLGMVLWDLYPEACMLNQGAAWGGILGGVAFIIGLRSYYKLEDEQAHTLEELDLLGFTRAGILLGIGIAVHNLPEGVAVGTVYADDPCSPLWRELALLMALHNIPEGLAVASTLRMARLKWAQIFLVLILTELPMGIGALLGGIIGRLSPAMSASALGFAAGAMFLLVWLELIPLSSRVSRKKAGWTGLGVGLLGAWLLIKGIG